MFYSVESEMKMVFCWLPKIRTAYPIIWDDLLSMFQYDINAQGLNASLFVVFCRRKNKAYLVHLENDNNKYKVSWLLRIDWYIVVWNGKVILRCIVDIKMCLWFYVWRKQHWFAFLITVFVAYCVCHRA